MKVLRNLLIVTAIVAMAILAWVVIRRNAPPLRLVQAANQVTVDVQTLGEYQTTVNRVRLLEGNRSVVWEIEAQGGDTQIRRLVLQSGKNRSHVDTDYGTYRIIAPPGSEFFVLTPRVKYTIESWGGKSALSRRSATFVLGN